MDHALEIRPARAGDAARIAPLLAQLGFPAAVPAIEARLLEQIASGEMALVAVRGEELLGLVTLHRTPVLHRPTPVGRLTALVVEERARGRGIGRALVTAAERQLRAAGCALVEVTSNQKLTQAHAFYRRLGYEVTSLRFHKSLELAEREA